MSFPIFRSGFPCIGLNLQPNFNSHLFHSLLASLYLSLLASMYIACGDGCILPFELCFAFLSLTQDIWSMSSPLCFVCALNLSFPQSCWSLNDLCGGCNCVASAFWSSLKRTEGSCFFKEAQLDFGRVTKRPDI